MSGESNPLRQLAAAWEAATAVVTEWAEQTAAVTSEAFHKLSSDPAIRAVLESWRTTLVWGQRDCKCVCARSHPDDMGICDKRAVITRRLPTDLGGEVDVPLCAPCAVAQGVAEMPRLSCMMGTVASGGSPGGEADGRAVRLVRPRSGPAAVMAAPLICGSLPPRALNVPDYEENPLFSGTYLEKMNNSVNKWRERRVNKVGGTSVRTGDIAGAWGDVWSRQQRRGGTATSGFYLVRGFYGRSGLCSDSIHLARLSARCGVRRGDTGGLRDLLRDPARWRRSPAEGGGPGPAEGRPRRPRR